MDNEVYDERVVFQDKKGITLTSWTYVDDPGKINSDPENEAWFFKLKIKDLSELDTLMNREEYDKFSKESNKRVCQTYLPSQYTKKHMIKVCISEGNEKPIIS